jgi:hypothetical protein
VALIAALALAPALWTIWAPISISTRDADSGALLYEVAFMGGLVGVLVGLHQADEWAWLTDRWPPAERLRAEAALLGLPVLALALIPCAWGLVLPAGVDPLAIAAALLSLARPVALGLLLRRLPLPGVPRALALLALCWWIPAIAAPSFLGLGPVPGLAAEPGGPRSLAIPGPWLAETTMLLALLLAARLGLGGATRRS